MNKNLFFIFLFFTILFTLSLTAEDGDYFKNLKEINPDPNSSLKSQNDWHKDAVFYHIWVKSFNDSDGDGFGDINGIVQKLDYLNDGNPETNSDLGVNAIWLSPIFESFGKGATIHAYDTIDHYKINEKFGTNEDVETLLKEAHKRGVRIIFDYIPNHISAYHPWFTDSINGGEKKDWFVWNKNPDQNYAQAWGGGKYTDVWHKVLKNKSYFYGAFHRSMPDLNFENERVKTEMANVLIYWLNKGFDGARVDAARYIFEDGPKKQADVPRTLNFFSEMRKNILDKYNPTGYSKIISGEVWTSGDIIKKYYGERNDRFHMCFDFPLTQLIRNAVYAGEKSTLKVKELNNYIIEQIKTYPAGYRSATFLNNHDNVVSRPMTDYEKKEPKAILAFALNSLLPGTPFVYFGNELGMENGPGSGDLRFRTDMEWDKLDAMEKNGDSILSWYKYLIKLRNSSDSIRNGDYREIKTSDTKVLAFTRNFDGKTKLVIVNFKKDAATVSLDFSGSEIKEGNLFLILGNLYNGDTNNIGEKYKNFLADKIPSFGVRVYSFNENDKFIAKDYGSNF